jgi:hypothetical protein
MIPETWRSGCNHAGEKIAKLVAPKSYLYPYLLPLTPAIPTGVAEGPLAGGRQYTVDFNVHLAK